MTVGELSPLMPAAILAAGSVIVLLTIAIRRSQIAAFSITVLALGGCLGSLFRPETAAQVTPLFNADPLSRSFTGLAAAANLFTALLSYRYMKGCGENREEFYILLLIETLGASVLAASAHFASFFLGLETLSVALYGLLAYTRRRIDSIEAGLKYLILASVASAIILFGMALIYTESGTLALEGLAGTIGRGATAGPLVLAGASMLVVGLGFKLALVPFHMWVGDVYQGAPAPSSAAIASVSKVAVIAVLYRFIPALGALERPALGTAVAVIAALSMLAGNWLALVQGNAKRMLAYSSIAHMGYLMIPLFLPFPANQAPLLFYLTAYVLSTVGSFGVITVLSSPERERVSLEEFRGLAGERPVVGSVFTVMLISLAGMPITMGFMGKLFLFNSIVGYAGGSFSVSGVPAAALPLWPMWMLAAALAAGSAIGLYFYLRLASFQLAGGAEGKARGGIRIPSVLEGIVLVLIAIALVGLGAFPAPFLALVRVLVPHAF
jgi:NADH-quinone oxidoreductase subunit N